MKTTNQQAAQIMPQILSVIFLFVFTILFPGMIQPAFAQRPIWLPTPSASPQGTVTVELKTDKGKVRVILPDDMRAGDTISGTVSAEQSPAQPAKVGGAVEGEVVEVKTVEGEVVATKKLDPSLPVQPLTFTVPRGASSLQFSIGKHIPQAVVSINAGPAGNPAQSGNFTLPRLGQTGRSISIPGNFDGHAANTGVGIGGRELPVIAESPRKAVVQIPADCPTGPASLTVKEGDLKTSAFNVVAIQLKADKLNLMKGEKTNLHIAITGLEGLKDNSGSIKLQIENASPQTVSLISSNPAYQSNGNAGAMSARAVNPDGGSTLTITEQLTGVSPGNFQIVATLLAPPAEPEQASVRDQVRKIADLKKEAANLVSGNSKAKKELEENAKFVTGTADNEKNWDKDGDPKNKEGFKKFLKDEKEKLDHIQKVVGGDSAAGQKIGEAKDAVDKAARDAGITLDE